MLKYYTFCKKCYSHSKPAYKGNTLPLPRNNNIGIDMKQFFCVIVMLLVGSVTVSTQALENVYRPIALTSVNDDDNRRIGPNHDKTPWNMPKSRATTRATVFDPVYVSLDNQVISVVFAVSFTDATISIVNEATGAVVYESVYANPDSINIDLSGESSGNYTIVVVAEEVSLEDEFSF